MKLRFKDLNRAIQTKIRAKYTPRYIKSNPTLSDVAGRFQDDAAFADKCGYSKMAHGLNELALELRDIIKQSNKGE